MKYQKKLPTDRKIGSNSLGEKSKNPTIGLDAKVSRFGLKAILLDQFKSKLFDEVEDAVYNELVTNSTHDSL